MIWDFASETVDSDLVEDVRRLDTDGPGEALTALLGTAELDALIGRVHRLVRRAVLPVPTNDHPYPWPLV